MVWFYVNAIRGMHYAKLKSDFGENINIQTSTTSSILYIVDFSFAYEITVSDYCNYCYVT